VRRESSTVVALVGEVSSGLLAGLGRSPNVSVARPPEAESPRPAAAAGAPPLAAPAGSAGASRPGWETGAKAMREAARRRSMYVLVPDDPLSVVAAGWRAMWDLSAGPAGLAAFEQSAADALAAWRGRQFELPDYYLVVAPVQPESAGQNFYLGPLRAARPSRVAVAGLTAAPGLATAPGQAGTVLDALRTLEHGPWWPPLDDLLSAARNFYAGGLAEAQQTLA